MRFYRTGYKHSTIHKVVDDIFDTQGDCLILAQTPDQYYYTQRRLEWIGKEHTDATPLERVDLRILDESINTLDMSQYSEIYILPPPLDITVIQQLKEETHS